MRLAYADPPYPGQSKKHYGDHPDYAGEVDHGALIEQLCDEYDAWVLHTHVGGLRDLFPLMPAEVRVLSWCKSFCAWKRNVYPAHAWEPIFMFSRQKTYGQRQTPPDFIVEPITMQRGTAGAKPERVCHWLFECMGAEPDDELHDLYPGSGAVRRAWESWCRTPHLAFPSEPETEALFVE